MRRLFAGLVLFVVLTAAYHISRPAGTSPTRVADGSTVSDITDER